MKNFEFKPPDLERLYDVRHRVLRPGKPRNTAVFEGDSDAIHFGLIQFGKAVAVLSFYLRSWNDMPQKMQYQLRGMAVLPEAQGQGLGAALLKLSESELLKKHSSLMIWCNARISAVDFYKKLGYKVYGEAFEIAEVGTHFKMYKKW